MKIEFINEGASEKLDYKTLLPFSDKPVDVQLPILIGGISGLPKDLDAIIVASDLQGLVIKYEKEELLGEVLADFLKLYIEVELQNLNINNIGVILCGDLFATLEKRGGLGDVRNVWNKFNSYFRWVAGIAGNHDSFGNKSEFEKFKNNKDIYFFDKETCEIDNLKIAGISGIIGKSEKPNRLSENEYLKILENLLLDKPDILLLHQTPSFPEDNISGNDKIRNILENGNNTLIFCGHNHWEYPLKNLKNSSQVLNVDSRAIILIKK